jgi:hypothetical protein
VRFPDVELHQGVHAHTPAPEHRVREGELKVPYGHGVTLHKCGRWEARMGQLLGKK